MQKYFLPFIAMALLMTVSFEAKAQTGIENYVSASGYMIYRAPGFNPQTSDAYWDFEEDFEEGQLMDWTAIDHDGDSHSWNLFPQGGYGHHGSNGMVVSYSYDNVSSSPLLPDNFLVSPRMTIRAGGMISFYFCAMDEAYPAEHIGVAISTASNTNPLDFTTLWEWTLTAKKQPTERLRNVTGDRQGDWWQMTVDLSAYEGQEAYLAIRHFSCSDEFALCVDDISIGDGSGYEPLLGCDIILDGQTVAQNQHGRRYLLNTDGFADGSNHTTTVRANYGAGSTLEETYAWTYRTSDHFQGSSTGLQAESDGDQVYLSWTLPEMNIPVQSDGLFYDFADSTLMDLTLIDANNDGQNFRVYPWSGYGGGIGLRSFSWMSGPGPLNPDNFIVTPCVMATENTVFSFKACDADMPGIAPDPEHFGVAVSTTGNTNPADFTMIQEWNSVGTYTEYSVDLSSYAGQQIYIALRHFNTVGETYYLSVDDIKVEGVVADVMRPAIGVLLFADNELIAMLNHGESSYTHYVNRYNSEYCIRVIQNGSPESGDYYALAAPQCAEVDLNCVAPKNLNAENQGNTTVLSWERDFFIDFEDDPQGWTFIDADGDGFIFGIYAAGGMNPDGSVNSAGTNASLTSFSYSNSYGPLQPDNFAFMPKTKVLENAKMTFYAAGFDPSYSIEHFGVAVASSDGQDIATIAEFDTRNYYQAFSVDLSAYEGQEIYLGFRHFTNVSNFALCIDNITVTNAVWAGTSSETLGYNIYRSTEGQDYSLIGWATGSAMHFDDNDTNSESYYYKVTAINSIVGGQCESAYAMAEDGIHDYVTVQTDGMKDIENEISVYPNPVQKLLTVEAEGLNRVTLINMLGQIVYDATADAPVTSICIDGLESGMYMVRIQIGNGVFVRQVSVVK